MEGRELRLAEYAQGWEGDLEHPDHPRAHERRHSRSLTCSDSAHFSQHKGFKLRQLKKKKKIQLLIWKREGRGEAQCRGEENPAILPFQAAPRADRGGGHGLLQELRMDVCGGSPGSHPPPANQPLEKTPRFPLSESLPRGSTPWKTFQVSPLPAPSLPLRP